ncbi:MAG: ABC-2 family transporter protein [bacterium]|nr:ABC-2 family transporter protein [bacterium]
MKELKFILTQLKIRFRNLTIFRTSFLLEFLGKTSWVIGYIIFYKIVFTFANNIGGWDGPSLQMLVGTAGVVFGLFSTFCNYGSGNISNLVRKGNVDFYLTKPISAPFIILFRYANIPSLFSIIPSLFVFYLGLNASGFKGISNLLLWHVSVILSFFIYSFLHFLLGLLSFKYVNLPALTWIIYDLAEYAKYPYKIFPVILQKLLLYVIPILLVTNFPVLILEGEHELLIVQITVLTVQILLIRILFPLASRAYQGSGTYEI